MTDEKDPLDPLTDDPWSEPPDDMDGAEMPTGSLWDRAIGMAATLPWWAIILAVVAVAVLYSLMTSSLYQNITRFLTDNPQVSTEDKFRVVLTAARDAKFVGVYRGETTDAVSDVAENLLGEVIDSRTVTRDGFLSQIQADQFSYRLLPLETIPADLLVGVRPADAAPDDVVTITYRTDAGDELSATGIIHTQTDAALSYWAVPETLPAAPGPEFACQGVPSDTALVPSDLIVKCADDGDVANTLAIRQDQLVRSVPEDPQVGDVVITYFRDEYRVIGVQTGESDKTLTIRTEDEEKLTVAKDRIISREPVTIPCKRTDDFNCQDREGEQFEIEGEELSGTLIGLSSTNVSLQFDDGTTRREFRRDLQWIHVPTLTIAVHTPEAGTTVLPEDALSIGYVKGSDLAETLGMLDEQTDVPVPLRYGEGDALVTLVPFEDVDALLAATDAGEVDVLLYLDSGDEREYVAAWVQEHADAQVRLIGGPRECARNCDVAIKLVDFITTGVVRDETDDKITIVTTYPETITIDKRDVVSTASKEPAVCALNNLRGCDEGIFLTLIITFAAFGIALVIGLFVGILRVQTNPILYAVSTLYVEVIRGIPMLVILLYVGFAIAPELRDGVTVFKTAWIADSLPDWTLTLKIDLSNRWKAILGLAFGYGAFIAEIFRAGIQSISRGQMEAARSLGMSYPQAMRHVVLPQAVRVVLPPLGNDFISLLKDSALISILALPDLLFRGRQYIGNNFRAFETYNMVAILYLMMTLFLSFIVRTIERRSRLPG